MFVMEHVVIELRFILRVSVMFYHSIILPGMTCPSYTFETCSKLFLEVVLLAASIDMMNSNLGL